MAPSSRERHDTATIECVSCWIHSSRPRLAPGRPLAASTRTAYAWIVAQCRLRIGNGLADDEHERLTCPDMEQDNALGRMAAMSVKRESVRSMEHHFGHGGLRLMRAGLAG